MDSPDSYGNVRQLNDEMDRVFQLLEQMESTNQAEVEDAKVRLDQIIENREKSNREAEGCTTVQSRTSINSKESNEDKRKKRSDDLKRQGNASFQSGDFKKAVELYTSAIMEFNANPVLFTNRAQAHNKLKAFDAAIQDCKEAIKLNSTSVKAQVHLAKALQGRGDLQRAIDVLEIAEDHAKEHTEVIVKYKTEIIAEMKEKLLSSA